MVRRSLAAAAFAALVAAGTAGAQSGVPRQVKGAVASVADKKLTLTLPDKSSQSWPIADNVRIRFIKSNVALTDVSVGDSVHVLVGKDGAVHEIQLLGMKKRPVVADTAPAGAPVVSPVAGPGR